MTEPLSKVLVGTATVDGKGTVIRIQQDNDVVIIPCLYGAIAHKAATGIMRWIRKAGVLEGDSDG